MMVDTTVQRLNMVESQVRPSDVTDRRILRAMQSVARETFVPAQLASLAYSDASLPLASPSSEHARAMLAPRTLAKMLQAAAVSPTDVVLDVGCATGYAAALLSRLAETVVALEEDKSLSDFATKALADLSADNVAVVTEPLKSGYEKAGPYDVILCEGAVAQAPDALIAQLKDGGRLVAIMGAAPAGKACLWQRTGDHAARTILFDANAPLLPGFAAQPVFSL